MIDERPGAAGAARPHEIRMAQPLGNQQHGPLELQVVDAEGQRGRQNFDEELRAVLRLRCDEQPVFTDRPYLALNTVQRAERVREGGAEFGHCWQVSPPI